MSRLDAREAAAVAAAMRAVALCDGRADPRELALLDAFVAELPEGVDPGGATFADDEARAALVQSMWLVAWADGEVTPDERATIDEIARAHGIDARTVELADLDARSRLLDGLAARVSPRAPTG